MALFCQEDAPEGDYYTLESGLFSVSVQLRITGRSRSFLQVWRHSNPLPHKQPLS
jgi:hypothetical protein